jgi:mono/diheme cytochrome c family protein
MRKLIFIAFLAVPAAAFAADGKAAPTFTKDVAPIFNKSCVECHRPTMFAPMSLTTFDEARPWARSIKQRVVSGAMPPWGADTPHGMFKNDPRLTAKEIETIAAWVDAGAPKGDDKDLPPTPTFADGWSIGKPDAIFTMDEEFTIPASGTIPYKYFKAPTGLTEDKWIQAIEIHPSARAQVHHVLAYTQPAGTVPKPGGELGPDNIGGVTPNKPGLVFEPGVARLLKGNSDIVMQIHYTANGTEGKDRTTIGVIYAKQPPTKLAGGGMAINPRFVIPAGDGNAEVRAVTPLNRDTLITSYTPHMHVRGKDMTYIAHYPDGTDETLLAVPRYDFNWQISYELAKPKLLPKGTKLEVIAHFDNSTGNKFNPDPTKDVKWGDQTWEEMMIGFFSTVQPPPTASATPQP